MEKYNASLNKVRSKKWAAPLGKTIAFTGHILKFAGKSGAPFVGILGSAIVVSSKVLNPDITDSKIEGAVNKVESIQNQMDNNFSEVYDKFDVVQVKVQEGFNEVLDKLTANQRVVEDLRNTAQKTLGMIAEMKWKDGLKRVEAYCKNIYSKKKLQGIINYIDASFNFFVEIQCDATQYFDNEKIESYMDFLIEEQGIEECIEFYMYAMALRSQFLSILVLYHSFKNDLDEVINNSKS